ncbi:MAG TPA: VOC family protein [Actinopolymorphaceae bacterium]|jgi:predicted enzyme related to lactoylglutathione lyase
MDVRAVDFVLISVSNLDRSIEFYRDVLGLHPETQWTEAEGPPPWVELKAGATTIAIGVPPPDAPQPPYNGGISVALAVPDIGKAMDELRDKGVRVIQEAFETPVCFMGLIADPDGNLLWLHQRKDGTAG